MNNTTLDILQYCKENNVTNYADFLIWCKNNRKDWFREMCDETFENHEITDYFQSIKTAAPAV